MNSKEETLFKNIINDCIKKSKDELYQKYTFEKYEEDNPPFLLTMRDTLEALPPKIEFIKITQYKNNETNVGFLLKYDYSELNSTFIKYHGVLESHQEDLSKGFCVIFESWIFPKSQI